MNVDRESPLLWLLRYGAAVAAVAIAFAVRLAVTGWFGPGLPTYITFFPAVMVVALVAGFGPGLLATALSGLTASYWVLPPYGESAIDSPVELIGLALFSCMGLFISAVAELYRRKRDKAAVYERELALRESLEALRAAAQRERFLAGVLEHASQAFAAGYPDGRLGQVNKAFEELTGYTAEELQSVDWATTLTPPEWRELERQKLAELNRTGQPIRYEKQYLRKDGTRVPIELLVHLVKDADGKPNHYSSFISDITQRKRTEEKLKRANAELAERVAALEAANAEIRASRKAALNLMDDAHQARQRAETLNAELRREVEERKHAEDLLRASLREKEVLLKEIHHRVKNNMQVISSLVSLQADGFQDAALREMLQDVRDRVRSMALVHEKLYQSENLAQVDFAEYARSLLNYLWRVHGEAAGRVRLSLALQPVPLSVETAVPCGLILNELAGNALKHAFVNKNAETRRRGERETGRGEEWRRMRSPRRTGGGCGRPGDAPCERQRRRAPPRRRLAREPLPRLAPRADALRTARRHGRRPHAPRRGDGVRRDVREVK